MKKTLQSEESVLCNGALEIKSAVNQWHSNDTINDEKQCEICKNDIVFDKQAAETFISDHFLINVLMHNLPDYIYFKDVKSRFIRISDAHARAFGLKSAKDAIGKTDFDFFSEIHACQTFEDEQEIMRTGKPIIKEEKETWTAHPDTWVSSIKLPMLNQKGVAIGTFGLSRDITERIAAEGALHRSEELYRGIMESVNLGISVIDMNHQIILTNKYFSKLLNKPSNYFVGKKCFREFEKREAICSHCPGVIAMASGKPAEVETIGIRDDGSQISVLLRTTPTYSSDGKVSGFIEVVEDITDRKIVENELRQSEEKLRTLFSSMTEIVVHNELVFDEKGKIIDYRVLDCNKAFTKIMGIERDSVLGKLGTEVYQTEFPPHLDEYTEVALTGKSCEFTDYSYPNGRLLIYSVISTKVNHFSIIGTDITVIQQVQEDLKTKNNELENYLYMASHDLRTPLVNIQGFSQRFIKQTGVIKDSLELFPLEGELKLSLEKMMNEDIPRTLNFILSNVTKMENLINGLLQLSRTGRVAMSIRSIDMNNLIRNIMMGLNYQISESSAEVIVGNLPNCYGDEHLLNQLFSNVISNSIKYRDPHRQLIIEISSYIKFNKPVYCIRDSGIGIETRHLEKIWDVFFRVDSSTNVLGDGIGLSLSKRIVDKHKGKIWVESEIGKGSVFFIELQRNEFSEK